MACSLSAYSLLMRKRSNCWSASSASLKSLRVAVSENAQSVAGFPLLLSAALEVYGTLKLRSANVNIKMYVAEITVSVVLAFVLFIVPAQVGLILIRIIGIGACIAGIGLIIWERTNRTTVIYAEKIDD